MITGKANCTTGTCVLTTAATLAAMATRGVGDVAGEFQVLAAWAAAQRHGTVHVVARPRDAP